MKKDTTFMDIRINLYFLSAIPKLRDKEAKAQRL